MDMTQLVKARGTCPRRQVGAVIVKDKRVLTTGYNGAPRNFPHPIDTGCLRDELEVPRGMVADICPCLHAEQNAIIQAATTGVSIEGADLYCTTQPCTQCSRMIANCGVKRVIFHDAYPDPLAVGILTTSGVELWQWDDAKKTAHPLGNPNNFQQAQDEIRKKWNKGLMAPAMPPGRVVASESTATRPSERGAKTQAVAPAAESRRPPADDSTDDAGVEPRITQPQAKGVRDISSDPHREELIRKMAQEKAERRRQFMQDADLPGDD